jgi:hypothetical protein
MQREPGECPILAKLASMMETPLERRFHELYSASAFRRAQESASQVLEKAVADPAAAGLPSDVGSEEWTQLLWRDLVATLTVPALLPQYPKLGAHPDVLLIVQTSTSKARGKSTSSSSTRERHVRDRRPHPSRRPTSSCRQQAC